MGTLGDRCPRWWVPQGMGTPGVGCPQCRLPRVLGTSRGGCPLYRVPQVQSALDAGVPGAWCPSAGLPGCRTPSVQGAPAAGGLWCKDAPGVGCAQCWVPQVGGTRGAGAVGCPRRSSPASPRRCQVPHQVDGPGGRAFWEVHHQVGRLVLRHPPDRAGDQRPGALPRYGGSGHPWGEPGAWGGAGRAGADPPQGCHQQGLPRASVSPSERPALSWAPSPNHGATPLHPWACLSFPVALVTQG